VASSWTLGLAGAALWLGASPAAAQRTGQHPTPETAANTVAVHVAPLLRLSGRAPEGQLAPRWLVLQREALATHEPRPLLRITLVAR